MPTLKQLRFEARLSVNRLAKLADVDRQTVVRAEAGEHIRELTAYALIDTLGKQLGREITFEQVEGLNIL